MELNGFKYFYLVLIYRQLNGFKYFFIYYLFIGN